MATGYYLLDYNPGTQQWGFPRRGGWQLTGTCIVHTAECARDDIGEDTSAEGSASMIANRADYGSYHRLVDSDSIIRMIPWEYEAWQDSETNNWAVGISAALRTSDWLEMPADRHELVMRNLAACGAEFVEYMRTKGIEVPLVRITGEQARAGIPGFCAHGDSGIARTDPGKDFDWPLFFEYIRQALAGGNLQEEEDMAISDNQRDFIIKSLESLVDNAVTKTDLLEQAKRTPGEVWAYTNPSIGGGDAYQILRDALALTNRIAGDVATVAAQAASGGASKEQIEQAVKDVISNSKLQVVPPSETHPAA
jgi:hypothetical protein